MAATAPSPADGGPVVAPTMLQIDPSENVGPATSKSITFEQPVELTGSKKKIVDMVGGFSWQDEDVHGQLVVSCVRLCGGLLEEYRGVVVQPCGHQGVKSVAILAQRSS